jgi:hypothetical protein
MSLTRLCRKLWQEWRLFRTKEWKVQACLLCGTWSPKELWPGQIVPLCGRHGEHPMSLQRVQELHRKLRDLMEDLEELLPPPPSLEEVLRMQKEFNEYRRLALEERRLKSTGSPTKGWIVPDDLKGNAKRFEERCQEQRETTYFLRRVPIRLEECPRCHREHQVPMDRPPDKLCLRCWDLRQEEHS